MPYHPELAGVIGRTDMLYRPFVPDHRVACTPSKSALEADISRVTGTKGGGSIRSTSDSLSVPSPCPRIEPILS
jgi:hypothetical protein